MSGVTFRALGSCRVHIFLRIADAPDQSFGALPEEVCLPTATLYDHPYGP